MNLLRMFRRSPPSIPDCGRELASWNALNTRERVKARARLMNVEMGRAIPEALR